VATPIAPPSGATLPQAFAYDSGEDDRTLSSWRAGYRNYYERQGKYAPDMLLYCERFKVIEIIKSVEP
jgi:uncharacterized protein YhfF